MKETINHEIVVQRENIIENHPLRVDSATRDLNKAELIEIIKTLATALDSAREEISECHCDEPDDY